MRPLSSIGALLPKVPARRGLTAGAGFTDEVGILINRNQARRGRKVRCAMFVGLATRLILPLAGGILPASAPSAEAAPAPFEVHPVWRSVSPTVVHRVDPEFPHKAARAGL